MSSADQTWTTKAKLTSDDSDTMTQTGAEKSQKHKKYRVPELAFRPKYPHKINIPRIVRSFKDDKEFKDVKAIYEKLGNLQFIERRTEATDKHHSVGEEVAKGLIRRFLTSQVYYVNEKMVGYALGSELLQDDHFFSSLFSGIMAETRTQVPHYVYTINFCDEVSKKIGEHEGVNDPAFTISVFSLMDVLKNVFEQTLRQLDLPSGTAYGWLNVWLLGAQQILICNKIPSDQHLRMFRNAVAHHQFTLDMNYVQLFNKNDHDVINWMIRITLADLFEVNSVLKMLHNSGYTINSSQDDQNMNRRKRKTDHLRDRVLAEQLKGLETIAKAKGIEIQLVYDILEQCDCNVDTAHQTLLELTEEEATA